MENEGEIGRRIEALDVSLFHRVDSQTTSGDRRSLLALQAAVRKGDTGYLYLEIGSYLGGSIQPHLLDHRCRGVYSIDKRPPNVPDVRGGETYRGNSTERMLSLLRDIAPNQVSKIKCFETDASQVDPRCIEEAADLCFIDGEHTPEAVLSDFESCLRLSKPTGIIAFHDADLVYQGLERVSARLLSAGTRFTSAKLGGSVYAIALGEPTALRVRRVTRHRKNALLYFGLCRLVDWGRRIIPDSWKHLLHGPAAALKRRLNA